MIESKKPKQSITTITPSGASVLSFLSPVKITNHCLKHREIIRQLAMREVVERYKGSIIGLGWSIIQPLMMLCVYTFVFAVIFKSRWGMSTGESRIDFALSLFMGLITFSIFSEMVNAAPSIILSNVNYVKKVVFPLEVLPIAKMLSVLVNAFFSLAVLLMGILFFHHSISWTIIFLPIVWLPLVMFALGCSYYLASLSVFIRDIKAAVGVITTMLFFLTPIFYPLHAVPEKYRIIAKLNPLAYFVEDSRHVVIHGLLPNWQWFSIILPCSILFVVAAFASFMKSKNGFSDVI